MASQDDDAPRESPARDAAITAAEVREIVRALTPDGVLAGEVLAQRCRASTWRSGDFERALAAAVAAGTVQPLPDGHYKLVSS